MHSEVLSYDALAMRLARAFLIAAVFLAGSGCDAQSSPAHAIVPARSPADEAGPSSLKPVARAVLQVVSSMPPPSVGSSAPPLPAKQVVTSCKEPCQGCTLLTGSGVHDSRRLTVPENALLVDLFHNYLLSADCLADPDYVELGDLKRPGRDISDVKAVVDGSFTAAGRKQALVVFFMGHCGVLGRHFEHYGLSVIVIIEAGKIVMVTEDGPTKAVDLFPIDLEDDGVTELIEVTADYASGTTFSYAEVWSVANDMTSLAHFDMARQSCLVDEPEYFESSLLTRWDPEVKRRCLLQRRQEFQCPARPPP